MECECIYVNNPELDIISDHIIYNQSTAAVHEFCRRALWASAEQHFAAVEKLIISPETALLDFGCGNGYFLKVAKDHGLSSVMGLEINQAAAKFAQQHFGIKVVADIPPYNSIKDKRFDLITLWGVIEHLPRPKLVLDLLREHMHEESWLVLQTPTEDAFIHKIAHRVNGALGRSWFVREMYQERPGGYPMFQSKIYSDPSGTRRP